MTLLLVVLPLALLLAAVLSQLGANGRLMRNGMVGLRIPSTMSSDEAWRAGHHAAAAPAWIGFIVTSVVAIASMLLFESTRQETVGAIVVTVIFVLTFAWLVVAASRAARAAEVRN